jgi:DNA-directed RNA polymerase specialized sigma24 family protein
VALLRAVAPTSIGVPTSNAPAPVAVDTACAEPAPRAPRADATLGRALIDAATGPEDAFDRLYLHAASALARQVELLTGDSALARESVTHAYDLAWQHWPEVARDGDPVGWVRAAAYAHALAPWQRWLPAWAPGHHHAKPRTPDDPLAAALLTLPPARRQAVLLHDGLGLDLPETAVEAEATEGAAAARIAGAREALTEAVPDLRAEVLPVRLGALLHAEPEPGPPDRPAGVRSASEHGVRQRTFGAYALTAVIALATTLAVIVTPDHQAGRDRTPGRAVPATHAPARAGTAHTGTPGP